MIRGYAAEISKIYSDIRENEARLLKERRIKIEKELPMVFTLEKKIAKLCIDLAVNSFKDIDDRETYLNNLRVQITNLRVKKSELLVSSGYSQDYVSLNYRCNKCKDTGYIGSNKCSCYKQKLVKLYYKNSYHNSMLASNNFEHFNINYYSTQKANNEPKSPRKNMEDHIIPYVMNYLKNFSATKDNLMFYGSSGTGKTFLSNCIAKDLLDKGYLVIYRTSDDIIHDLKKVKFENDHNLENLLLNCDLLILDDLGTEQITDFTSTELFNLLNKKLLMNKKMLISSNYELEKLSRTYSERITSRLFGDFNLFKFYGDDIRIKTNLQRQKQ